MNILLDENNYFTGNYGITGKLVGGIDIDELPPYNEIDKQLCCKYENKKWIFDKDKYQELLDKKQKEKIETEIQNLQKQLSNSDYKIIKCNECNLLGLELPYNIEELHTERQAIRDKINKLQSEV